jgi:hypothetical protein
MNPDAMVFLADLGDSGSHPLIDASKSVIVGYEEVDSLAAEVRLIAAPYVIVGL